MNKVLINLALLTVPVVAQVSPLLPTKPANIREMTAPPAPSAFAAGIKSIGQTAPQGRSLYRWSLAAVVAANGADVASSWSQQEANPLVAGGGSQFGMRSVAIKTGFVATSLLIQHVALRHRPDFYKKLAWMNFATAGVLGAVAKSNMDLR